jgi:hypothetical protein
MTLPVARRLLKELACIAVERPLTKPERTMTFFFSPFARLADRVEVSYLRFCLKHIEQDLAQLELQRGVWEQERDRIRVELAAMGELRSED